MEYGRLKRQGAGVNTEEGRATDHLDTPIIEVKRMVRRDGSRFRFKGRLIVESEVGKAGDTC
jgi:hypothetical protein